MKKRIKTLALSLFILWSVSAGAQIFGNDPEIKIDGMAPESVWQIAEMAMNENDIAPGKFDPGAGVLMSDWIQWTAIAIKNHAHLYLKYESPALIVKIADREYASNEGWSEAVGNLSKKNYKKYVQNVADRIEEIKNDPALIKKAVKTSKLIPAFNAVHRVGDLEWKLLSLTSTDNNRPEFVFEITNKGKNPVKIRMYTSDFQQINGTGTARCGVKWEKPAEDYKYALIEPGTSNKGFFSVGAGYHLQTTSGHYLHMKYAENDNSKNQNEFLVYSIPMPYVYQVGD